LQLKEVLVTISSGLWKMLLKLKIKPLWEKWRQQLKEMVLLVMRWKEEKQLEWKVLNS